MGIYHAWRHLKSDIEKGNRGDEVIIIFCNFSNPGLVGKLHYKNEWIPLQLKDDKKKKIDLPSLLSTLQFWTILINSGFARTEEELMKLEEASIPFRSSALCWRSICS